MKHFQFALDPLARWCGGWAGQPARLPDLGLLIVSGWQLAVDDLAEFFHEPTRFRAKVSYRVDFRCSGFTTECAAISPFGDIVFASSIEEAMRVHGGVGHFVGSVDCTFSSFLLRVGPTTVKLCTHRIDDLICRCAKRFRKQKDGADGDLLGGRLMEKRLAEGVKRFGKNNGVRLQQFIDFWEMNRLPITAHLRDHEIGR